MKELPLIIENVYSFLINYVLIGIIQTIDHSFEVWCLHFK